MKEFIKKTSYSLFLFFILLLSHHFSQDSVIRLQSVIDPVLSWHTYMGKNLNDAGEAIAVDEMGNVYIAGLSNTTWGSPVNPYAGGQDVFVGDYRGTGHDIFFNISKICLKIAHILPLERQFYPKKTTSKGFF